MHHFYLFPFTSKKLKWLELRTKPISYAFGVRKHSYKVILKIWGQINLQFSNKGVFLTKFYWKPSVFGLPLARVSLCLYLYKIY